MSQLGVLTKVDIRESWKDEKEDFTPWLANNIDFLSKAIGIELEVEAKEKKSVRSRRIFCVRI